MGARALLFQSRDGGFEVAGPLSPLLDGADPVFEGRDRLLHRLDLGRRCRHHLRQVRLCVLGPPGPGDVPDDDDRHQHRHQPQHRGEAAAPLGLLWRGGGRALPFVRFRAGAWRRRRRPGPRPGAGCGHRWPGLLLRFLGRGGGRTRLRGRAAGIAGLAFGRLGGRGAGLVPGLVLAAFVRLVAGSFGLVVLFGFFRHSPASLSRRRVPVIRPPRLNGKWPAWERKSFPHPVLS